MDKWFEKGKKLHSGQRDAASGPCNPAAIAYCAQLSAHNCDNRATNWPQHAAKTPISQRNKAYL